ncbi:MAG: hypothetical protein Rubg2KO_21510 [Rubricoccaceae bacterium]
MASPRVLLPVLAVCLSSALHAQSPPLLTPEAAESVFNELAALSTADGGELWGIPLYGPVLLVDPATRRVLANDPGDGLQLEGGVYAGTLPETIPVANTAVTWNDRRWTMLMWPVPTDLADLRSLGAHELWHRVQDDLGLASRERPTLHLGTRDGRLWLRLEWRALAAALGATGSARQAALEDALLFRSQRLALFLDASEAERTLLMNEGLAEYTGVRLSGRSTEEQHAHAAEALAHAESSDTFVRSFAYSSGPAYGLLLDTLAPSWRSRAVGSDLPVLAAEAVGFKAPRQLEAAAEQAAASYGGSALMAEEDAIAEAREYRLADLRYRFIEGPVLQLDFRQMNVSFDPGTVDALDDLGTVYKTMRITDAWGTLEVTHDGLIAADWRFARVPAPYFNNGRTWTGDGYTLTLAEGWSLAPGPRAGDLAALERTAMPEIDISGVAPYWALCDQLAEGTEPDASSWAAYVETPGLAAFLRREGRRRAHLQQSLRLACDPSQSAAADSVRAGGGYLGEVLLPHVEEVVARRQEIALFLADLDLGDTQEQALRLAQGYLPTGVTQTHPPAPVSIAPFVPGGRGYTERIVADPLDLMAKADLTAFFAHEYHHGFRNRVAISMSDFDEEDSAFLYRLLRLEEEGIADRLDKAHIPDLSDAEFASRYADDEFYTDYREAFAASADWLQQLDDVLAALHQGVEGAEARRNALTNELPAGGRPLGAYMARMIEEELGRDALIAVVGDVFGFIRVFERAAEQRGGVPLFSAPARAQLDAYEARYVETE